MPKGRQLLVSVRNADEARLAKRLGVEWIDLKSPAVGPLGAPDLTTALEVGDVLSDFEQRSVALGELRECTQDQVTKLTKGFPVAKVGLSGLAKQPGWQTDFRHLAANLHPSTRLIPVLYADASLCAAPSVDSLLDLVRDISSPFLLIDTFTKDGRSLLDFLSPQELQQIVERAAEASCRTVLAGSLRRNDLDALFRVDAFAIAIRGAVCTGQRTDAICQQLLQEWVNLFASR